MGPRTEGSHVSFRTENWQKLGLFLALANSDLLDDNLRPLDRGGLHGVPVRCQERRGQQYDEAQEAVRGHGLDPEVSTRLLHQTMLRRSVGDLSPELVLDHCCSHG